MGRGRDHLVGEAGKRLDQLDLPAPFQCTSSCPSGICGVMRLYQVGGLSYGNLSARKDATRFWMSASGVDKTQLETVGRDYLLVTATTGPTPASSSACRRESSRAASRWTRSSTG